MHAERDYLVKRVFPGLRLWCSERRLNLIEVDLRWGVSEADATRNKRVVEVCLENLDRCRPFLIGLLGQRRGWVPCLEDVNARTLERYPNLAEYLGRHSITELELIHGLLGELDGSDHGVRHAILCARDPRSLEGVDSPEIRRLFVDEEEGRGAGERMKRLLSARYAVGVYEATWNPALRSPELVNVGGQDLSSGRLEHFRVGEESLAAYVTRLFKRQVEEEFPEHFAQAVSGDELDIERLHQDTFLFRADDAYIARPREERRILAYFEGDDCRPYILQAPAGMGKTSLVAHLVRTGQISGKVLYCFAGTSLASSTPESSVGGLLELMVREQVLDPQCLEHEEDSLTSFGALLSQTNSSEQLSLIMEGVDQWDAFCARSLRWLPERLPSQVRLLVSLKQDGNEQVIDALRQRGCIMGTLAPFADPIDKQQMIHAYLSQFLKDIDDNQIERMLSMPGSDNPLYLKIVLQELRVHGSYETLLEQFDRFVGTTPREAFGAVVERIERERFCEALGGEAFAKAVLGALAYAREAIPIVDLSDVLATRVVTGGTDARQDLADGIEALVHHLAAYLVLDGERMGLRYESLRLAVQDRYGSHAAELHGLLEDLYLQRAHTHDTRPYEQAAGSVLSSLAYHALRSSEERTEHLLTDAWYVHALLASGRSIAVASIFEQAAERGYGRWDYRTIASLVRRHAAQLDLGARLLFHLLATEAHGHTLADELCRRAQELDLSYYYPVCTSVPDDLVPYREMRLHDDLLLQYETYLVGDDVVYLAEGSDDLIVQSTVSEEMERRRLPHGAFRWAYLDGAYLYVWYSDGDAQTPGAIDSVETFAYPSLRSVFSHAWRYAFPEGYRVKCRPVGIGGRQYACAVREGACPALMVVDLQCGEPVICSETPEEQADGARSISVELCGPLLVESLMGTQHQYLRRVWHVPTGKLLHEGRDASDFSMTTDGERLWYVVRMGYQRFGCSVYALGDGAPVLLSEGDLIYEKDERWLPSFVAGVSDGMLYLMFDRGTVAAFGQDLAFAGAFRWDAHAYDFSWQRGTYHQPMHTLNGDLAVFWEHKLRFFDQSDIRRRLAANAGDTGTVIAQVTEGQLMPHGQMVSLLSRACRTVDLCSLEVVARASFGQFTYEANAPYRFGGRDHVLGYRWDDDAFEVQMLALDDLSVALRLVRPWPSDKNRVAGAYLSGHVLGVLLERTQEGPVDGSSSRTQVWSIFEVHEYDLQDELRHLGCWDLGARSVTHAPCIYQGWGQPYLLIRSDYVDERRRAVRLYDVAAKELVFSLAYDTEVSLLNNDGVFFEGGCLHLPFMAKGFLDDDALERDVVSDSTMITLHVYDVLFGTHSRTQIEFGDIRSGVDEFYSCTPALGILQSEMHAYAAGSCRALGCARSTSSAYCRAVVRKGDDVLAFYAGGLLEVFDGASYELRYRQYWPDGYVVDCRGTGYVYVGDKTRHHHILGKGNTRQIERGRMIDL